MAPIAGWSVDGKRVEVRAGFPAGKLVVDGGDELKLSAKGVWPVRLGKRTLTLKRTAAFLGPKTELFAGPELIPPTPAHVGQVLAPDGSLCARHREAAALITCARCGSFACEACAGPDRTHCRTCLEGLAADAARKAAAAAYMAPVVVFGIGGGLLGALFGGVAGAAAVAIARKTESKALKLGAAVALYGVAAIAYIIVAVLIRGSPSE